MQTYQEEYVSLNSQQILVKQRKQLAKLAVANYGLSVRTACKLFKISRTAYYYEPLKINDAAENRLIEIIKRNPEYGYWKVYNIIRDEGFNINHKRVYRIHKRWHECFNINNVSHVSTANYN